MKRFILTLSLAATIAATIAAPLAAQAAAVPVVSHSTRWFDNQLVHGGKKLDITGRVVAGTIEAAVLLAQTQTIDGQKVPVYAAVDANMTALVTHCKLSRRADAKSEAECKYKPSVRYFPTTIVK